MTIQRYELDQGTDYHPAATMDENPLGDWCRYEDVEAELARLQAQLCATRWERDVLQTKIDRVLDVLAPAGTSVVEP